MLLDKQLFLLSYSATVPVSYILCEKTKSNRNVTAVRPTVRDNVALCVEHWWHNRHGKSEAPRKEHVS
jgi:hypothetical protein